MEDARRVGLACLIAIMFNLIYMLLCIYQPEYFEFDGFLTISVLSINLIILELVLDNQYLRMIILPLLPLVIVLIIQGFLGYVEWNLWLIVEIMFFIIVGSVFLVEKRSVDNRLLPIGTLFWVGYVFIVSQILPDFKWIYVMDRDFTILLLFLSGTLMSVLNAYTHSKLNELEREVRRKFRMNRAKLGSVEQARKQTLKECSVIGKGKEEIGKCQSMLK